MHGIYDISPPHEELYAAYVSGHLTCNRLLDAIKIYDMMLCDKLVVKLP
jgi:hypothetical protein